MLSPFFLIEFLHNKLPMPIHQAHNNERDTHVWLFLGQKGKHDVF